MPMTFSTYAATAIVPTLSRLVLALAFVIAGANKLFKVHEFSGEDAARLIELGAASAPAGPAARPASFSQDAAQESADRQPPAVNINVTPADAHPESTASPADQAPPGAPASGDAPSDAGAARAGTGAVQVRALHHVTLMLDRAGLPKYQPHLAWLASLTEFVGGSLLLIGLFSRIWGLGLAFTMGVAFYLTSLPAVQQTPNLFALAEHPLPISTLIIQLALFVMALGIFLVGPGPLSLDRALFGRGEAEHEPTTAA